MNLIEPLTKRQIDVFNLLVKGLTDVEIAFALKIGRRTINSHVGQILQKTGLENRKQVINKYREGK
jgi:DNA-binding NarL/FixJ family response regulator